MAAARALRWQHAVKRMRRAGFTLIELVVTIIVVAILATVLLDRMLFYRDQAERVAMQQVVGNLRSALHLQLTLLLVRNREQELLQLAQQNPMDWLAEKPGNYLGEIDVSTSENLEKGNWYFDKRDKRLLYLFARETGETGKSRGNRVYLKVKLLRTVPANQLAKGGALKSKPEVDGIVLEQLGPQ